jgi:hypothetical protein
MKFSVGRIKVGVETIGKCTGVSVRADGGAVDMYAGGYQLPLETELGNRSVTISVDYVEWTGDPKAIESILSNDYVDVELLASAADAARGLSGVTLARCKATSYEMTSTQDGFVTYRLELKMTQTLES